MFGVVQTDADFDQYIKKRETLEPACHGRRHWRAPEVFPVAMCRRYIASGESK